MRSELVRKILKETPLSTRLKVSNEIAFINLITELGFRPDKMWDDTNEEDSRILTKLLELAEKHMNDQIALIQIYESDQASKDTKKETTL